MGNPFGLNKKDIPLISKIYKIISSFETITALDPPDTVLMTLKLWSEGGYFDNAVFDIFLEHLESNKIPKKIPMPIVSDSEKISEYRKGKYDSYISVWLEIQKNTSEITKKHIEMRLRTGDLERMNVLNKEINELKTSLIQKADLRNIFIVTRHGETVSDIEG